MECFVVLRIRRDIGLRAGLLVPFRFEMPAQRRLAARIGARLEFLRHVLQDLDVGRDAFGLDRAAGRGEIARGGQPQAPLPEPSGMMVCTDPLPNDRVPMTVARR